MITNPFPFATISVIFLSFYLTIPCYGTTSPVTLVTNAYCYPNGGNYTGNSPYQRNLETALSKLASRSSRTHFYNNTVGSDDNDKVFASFYCRYDLSFDICETCVNEATKRVVTQCPYEKEALVNYYECSLRYANRNYFSLLEVRPLEWRRQRQPIVDDGQMNRTIDGTMQLLIEQATSESNSYRYFATGEYSSNSDKLHGLVQCTPDISSLDCKTCLKSALNATTNSTAGRKWGMVFLPNCQMRYSLTSFYDTTSMAPDSPDPDTETLSHGGPRQTNPSYTAVSFAVFHTIRTTGFLIALFV